MTTVAIPSLVSAITLSHITHMDLSSCQISDSVICSLAPAFCRSNLLDVALSMNKIGNEGCKTLGECLENSTNLKALDLALNPLDADGLIHLVNALEINDSLVHLLVLNNQSLCVSYKTCERTNDFTFQRQSTWDHLCERLQHLLRLNRVGRRLHVNEPATLPQALQHASKQYGENGLFYLLRKHPSLLAPPATMFPASE